MNRLKRAARRMRYSRPLKDSPPYGWTGIDPRWARMWAHGTKKPKSDRHWRIQFKSYLRANAYVGWDFDRRRFFVGDGTPCPRGGRFRNRIGWRQVAFG